MKTYIVRYIVNMDDVATRYEDSIEASDERDARRWVHSIWGSSITSVVVENIEEE